MLPQHAAERCHGLCVKRLYTLCPLPPYGSSALLPGQVTVALQVVDHLSSHTFGAVTLHVEYLFLVLRLKEIEKVPLLLYRQSLAQCCMGSALFWGAREGRRADHETVNALRALSKRLRMSVSELEELQHIFLLQHPDGVMLRQCFVTENTAAHGGCEALWNRVFDVAAANGLDDDASGHPRRLGTSQPRAEHMNFTQVMLAATQGRHRRDTITFESLVKQVFAFVDLHDDGFVDEGELRTVIGWLYALRETVLLRESPEILTKFCGHVPQPAASSSSSGGGISLETLEHLYPPLVDASERAAQILRWMDLDQDGVICEAEFMEACRGDQSFVEAFSFVPVS